MFDMHALNEEFGISEGPAAILRFSASAATVAHGTSAERISQSREVDLIPITILYPRSHLFQDSIDTSL